MELYKHGKIEAYLKRKTIRVLEKNDDLQEIFKKYGITLEMIKKCPSKELFNKYLEVIDITDYQQSLKEQIKEYHECKRILKEDYDENKHISELSYLLERESARAWLRFRTGSIKMYSQFLLNNYQRLDDKVNKALRINN